ncbi:MAG: DNA-3-methyladenine glycosylase [Microthrixaceae bacterium]
MPAEPPLVVSVARALLGWRLISELGAPGDPTIVATITETEAYGGADDPASHAHRGPTPRNAAMFGPAGRLYVYRSYGLHWCANVVVGAVGTPSAVLLRAVALEADDPVVASLMSARRPKARRPREWANGPGKLAAALAIEGGHNGVDLFDPGSSLRLIAPDADEAPRPMVATPRVGISRATHRRWRFLQQEMGERRRRHEVIVRMRHSTEAQG